MTPSASMPFDVSDVHLGRRGRAPAVDDAVDLTDADLRRAACALEVAYEADVVVRRYMSLIRVPRRAAAWAAISSRLWMAREDAVGCGLHTACGPLTACLADAERRFLTAMRSGGLA